MEKIQRVSKLATVAQIEGFSTPIHITRDESGKLGLRINGTSGLLQYAAFGFARTQEPPLLSLSAGAADQEIRKSLDWAERQDLEATLEAWLGDRRDGLPQRPWSPGQLEAHTRPRF
jgi:hypothetical protein